MLKKKNKWIMATRKQGLVFLLVLNLAVLVSGMFIGNQKEPYFYHIKSCMLDGVFVWASDRFLVLGLIPIIVIIFMGIIMEQELRPICIIKRGQRWDIWMRQQWTILFFSAVSMAVSMAVSAAMAYAWNDGRTGWEGLEQSYYAKTVELYGTAVSDYSVVKCLLLTWIINTLEIFLIVLVGNLIYWSTKKRLIAVLIVCANGIVFGVNPQTAFALLHAVGAKVYGSDYYAELLVRGQTIKIAAILAVCYVVTTVLARYVAKKRDFL